MYLKFVCLMTTFAFTGYTAMGIGVGPPEYSSYKISHPTKFEIVDSCFLYLGEPGDLNALLDQLAEIFKDLEVQDVREWFKREITMAGYILKVPILKGHEHLYVPLMERFGLPKNPVVSQRTYFPPENDEVDIGQLVTTESAIISAIEPARRRVISVETQPAKPIRQEIPIYYPDTGKMEDTVEVQPAQPIRQEIPLYYPDTGKLEDKIEIQPEMSLYYPGSGNLEDSMVTQPANLIRQEIPKYDPDTGTFENKIELHIPQSIRQEIPLYSTDTSKLQENREQNLEPSMSLELETDEPHREIINHKPFEITEEHPNINPLEIDPLEKTLPQFYMVEERHQGKDTIIQPLATTNSNLPEWFLNEKGNHEPRYSVVDLYRKFPQLARLMGYIDNRDCKVALPSLTGLNIDPKYFVQSLKSLSDYKVAV